MENKRFTRKEKENTIVGLCASGIFALSCFVYFEYFY